MANQQYDNTDQGVLFRNKDKDDAHPRWPDYQGSINVGGVEYWLSAWLKESREGKKFLSLQVKPKEERQQAPPPRQPALPPSAPVRRPATQPDKTSANPNDDPWADEEIPF